MGMQDLKVQDLEAQDLEVQKLEMQDLEIQDSTQREKLIRPIDVDCGEKWKLASALLEFQDIAEIDAVRLGVGSDVFGQNNITWILSQIELHITKMPRLHDKIVLTTWHGEWRKFFFLRFFKAFDLKGNTLIEGLSNWVIIDSIERKMVTPAKYDIEFPPASEKKLFVLSKIRLSGVEFNNQIKISPVYSDFDMNGHVNNTKYIEWIMNSIPFEEAVKREPVFLNIIYKKEIVWGDKAVLDWQEEAGKYIVRGSNADTGEVFFECILHFK